MPAETMRGSNRHDCPAHGVIENDYFVVVGWFLLSSISTAVRTSCLPEFLPGSLFIPRWLWPPRRLLFESAAPNRHSLVRVNPSAPAPLPPDWFHLPIFYVTASAPADHSPPPLLLLPPALMERSRYGCVSALLVGTTWIHQAMLLYPYVHSFALIN
jgi:hypothetical protein